MVALNQKKIKMKKNIIVLILSIISIPQIFAQNTSTIDFIGQWTCDKTSVEMVIWKDKIGNFQVALFDKSDGEMLECNNVIAKDLILSFTSRTKSTNSAINSTYTLIDEMHLIEVIAADLESEEIKLNWKKVK